MGAPLVQLPPESVWNLLIVYGLAIIVAKLAYQVPLACPCYQDWTESNLNNASHFFSTFSLYPFCNASHVQENADTCKWEKPSMVSRNDILPYDHLLGVHKVYSESISNNTIMHILDAQHSGALFQNIAITLMSVLACLFHSYVMHRQKLYSILDFMRSSTTAVGASGSLPGSQSTTKRFRKSVGDMLKKHLNGSDSEQLHPSFGLSTGRTQDNVQSPKFHAAHVESASKRERPRVATLSSTTGADNAASEEDIMTSVMWRKHHQEFGTI